jgi:excisionase family DNA binding protein
MSTTQKYIDPTWEDVPSILSTNQVRTLLGVHINTVKKMITEGELPAYKVGRAYRVNKIDLMKYMGLYPNQ